jgi:hypothetical protein
LPNPGFVETVPFALAMLAMHYPVLATTLHLPSLVLLYLGLQLVQLSLVELPVQLATLELVVV